MQTDKIKIGLVFTGGTIEATKPPVNQIIDVDSERIGSALIDYYIKSGLSIHEHYDFAFNRPFGMLSENIIPSEWQKIAEAIALHVNEGVDGIVVTHGTDTMPYTASAISFMLSEIPIPIVFTGSFIPPCEKDSDSIQNLNDSILFAAKSELSGVFVVFHNKEDNCGYMFKGNQLKSVALYGRNFYNANCGIAIKFQLNPFFIISGKEYPKSYILKDKIKVIGKIDPRVDYYRVYPGFDPRNIELAIERGSRGIILELYHSGTACTKKDCIFRWSEVPGKDINILMDFLAKEFCIEWIWDANIKKLDEDTIKIHYETNSILLKLSDKKTYAILEINDLKIKKFDAKMENNEVKIYKDSEYSLVPCIKNNSKKIPIFGLPWYESPGSNIYRTTDDLRTAGLRSLNNMSSECALVKLMWLLGTYPEDINTIIKKMNENIAGEFLD